MKGNIPKKRKVIDDRTAWEHYNAGETDAQIAEACGVHKNTVNNWRRRQGLLSHSPQNKARAEREKKARELPPLARDARAAREAGLTYGQYKAQQYIEQTREKARFAARYKKATEAKKK